MNEKQFKKFITLAVDIFEESLMFYKFKLKSKEIKSYFCNIVFVNGERYITISANIHHRDNPPYFNIILGEGSLDFCEVDWNSIALWRLKNLILKNDSGKEYSLESVCKLSKLLEHSRDELLKFGDSFLKGDVKLFRQVLFEMNKSRQSYKIYSINKNGNYSVNDDPISVIMKNKRK